MYDNDYFFLDSPFQNENYEDYEDYENNEENHINYVAKEHENENNVNHSYHGNEKEEFKFNVNQEDLLKLNNEKDCKCNNLKDNNNNISYIGNKSTKVNSKTLSKKRQRSDDENQIKKQGRKKKYDDEKGEHDKFSEDNMIRKIKSNFIKHIHETINNNISDKDSQLLRLDPHFNEILKKDFNLQLMSTTFKNLYENTAISSKYRNKDANSNKYLIDKLYNEERYTQSNAISDLDKTYKELYDDYINNHLDELLNKIKNELEKEGKESKENIAEYIEKFKNLCLTYEDWFKNKKGRNRMK
jgi:hypothetical protein